VPEPAPARHELPDIDAAALRAARAVDALLDEGRRLVADGPRDDEEGLRSLDRARHAAAADRWMTYLRRVPDDLRDEPVPQIRSAARRVRAAFGPKDSIRETFAPDLTEPLLDAVDRLLKVIATYEAHRD
jgi:hypothetical protein